MCDDDTYSNMWEALIVEVFPHDDAKLHKSY
jgi:hypothetical protein